MFPCNCYTCAKDFALHLLPFSLRETQNPTCHQSVLTFQEPEIPTEPGVVTDETSEEQELWMC